MSDTPLFDLAVDRVLESLSSRCRVAFRVVWLLDDEGLDLRPSIERHLKDLEGALSRNEFLDIELARNVAARSGRLLDWLDGAELSDHQRALGRAAVRYFVLIDDGASDADSILGLEDDAAVLDAVARELGCVGVLGD